MRWHLMSQGLKQFIAKAALPQSLAPADDPAVDDSIRDACFGDDDFSDEGAPPYSPDSRNARSESSLHLSC